MYLNQIKRTRRNCRYSFWGPVGLRIPAIALTRVCRQIYSETATLAYEQVNWRFHHPGALMVWIDDRITAQREVTKYLTVNCAAYFRLILHPACLLSAAASQSCLVRHNPYIHRLGDAFPNLERLQIDVGSQYYFRGEFQGFGYRRAADIQRAVRQREDPDGENTKLRIVVTGRCLLDEDRLEREFRT